MSSPGKWLPLAILFTLSASVVKMLGPDVGPAYPEPVLLTLRGSTLVGSLFIVYFSVEDAMRTTVS